jgi:hypothetical protein
MNCLALQFEFDRFRIDLQLIKERTEMVDGVKKILAQVGQANSDLDDELVNIIIMGE